MRACASRCAARSTSRQAQRVTRRTPPTSTGLHPVPWHSGQSFLAISPYRQDSKSGRPSCRRNNIEGFKQTTLRTHGASLSRQRKPDLSIYHKWAKRVEVTVKHREGG